ncbi:unnamed protein product, partial [Rotaria socialis]
NENQIHRLKADFDELILTKQEVLKTNYILVQNAESLREQLRTFVEKKIHKNPFNIDYYS